MPSQKRPRHADDALPPPRELAGITNRKQLQRAVAGALLRGIGYDEVCRCYKYARNDADALVFDGHCYVHQHNGARMLYAPGKAPTLRDAWNDAIGRI